MRRLEIGVIGAGMGGMAATALLARAGHEVTLIERFDTPRPLGSGLVVQPVGLSVLAELGLADLALSLGARMRRMIGHAGNRKALDVSYPVRRPGLAMHRASLFHCLWQGVAASGAALQTGARVHAAPAGADGRRRVETDAGTFGPFDLVIDASGAGSALSPLKTRALPFGAVWATVPWPAGTDLEQDMLHQRYQAASQMAGIMPIGRLPDDPTPLMAVFWSLPRADLAVWGHDPAGFARWKGAVEALWPEMARAVAPLQDAMAMTPAGYGHGTLSRPFAPGLAFIGDSAHRASPQLGQGANMALLDAYALTVALADPDHETTDAALAAYARMRRWHVRLYQLFSAALTPAYQSHSRSLPVLRDLVLAPMARIWPVRSQLTRLVAGDLIPPLASTAWPPKE